ncbi:hypothetical protein LTR56_014716 [Elasticomyces elasticus]|nr:hypothetical protein LTR56_014716 [Elasticomyces elasticus]KAK3645486.1 hypothetical protein LTR22_014748 [Elasticomyces elasticus]KAK4915842.1 hypothetical protein LTR49_016100 [Elasticomyces elasticus]KAK5755562.1 hypothetical protein LTS12_014318 [Elasticomyces elasticus]
MPTPISDRYRRYKAGTTKITGWLKTAAKGCSDIGQSLANLCDADDDAGATRGSMTAQDLVRLATVIATSTQPKVEIPLEILVVVEDVIEGRQASADWYAGTDHGVDGETEKANQRHRKFIEVLKKVHSVLKEKYVARLPKSYKKKPEKIELDKAAILDNIYEYLDLEDPKAPTTTPSPRRVTRSVPRRATPRQGGEQSLLQDLEEADKVFALWCFFKDQYDSCSFLKDAWQEYKDGKLSFTTICQVTDTAFMLMEKANTALTAQYPDFKDMDGVNGFLGFTMMSLGGHITVVAFQERKVCTDIESKPALHELFCTRASGIMHEFREALCRPEDYNSYPEEARNISHPFSVALRVLAPELRLLAVSDDSEGDMDKHTAHVHEDMFLRHLVRLVKDATLSPWLVSACQAYMHIYDGLGVKVPHGQMVLHDEASWLSKSMTDHMHHMSSLQDRQTTPLINFFRGHLLANVDGDVVQLLHKDFLTEERKVCPPDFRMRKLLPVTCGSLLFMTQQSCHIFGVLDCNAGFNVLAAAYLYKAARLAGVFDAEWEDMEWLLKQHDRLMILVGKTSQPLEAFAKHYLLALGRNPAATYAYRRYTRSDTTNPAFQYADIPTPQQVKENARILGASGCSPYIRHMAEESEKNKAYTSGDSPWNGLQELVLHKVANDILQREPAGVAAAKQGKVNSNKMTAVQLLVAFKQMLKDDEPNFRFDYFGFLRSCSDLMTVVLTTCDPAGDHGVQAAFRFVNLVLWEAASTEKKGNALNLQQTMLFRCGGLLAAHINRVGTVAASSRSGSPQLTAATPTDNSLQALLGPIPCMREEIFRELAHTVRVQKDVELAVDSDAKVMTIHVAHIKTKKEMVRFLQDLWGSGPVPGKPKKGLGWIKTIAEPVATGGNGEEETANERGIEEIARYLTDGLLDLAVDSKTGDRKVREEARKALGRVMRDVTRDAFSKPMKK